jgi:hypothetical protein
MRDMQELLDVLFYINNIYHENLLPNKEYFNLCKRFGRLTKFVVLITFILYIAVGSICSLPTMIEYFLNGKIVPCVYLYFVGVQEYSREWLIMLNVYNYAMLINVVPILVAVDTIIFMTFANFRLMTMVIENEINDFQLDLEQNRLTNDKIRCEFVRIIELCKQYSV